MTRDSEVTARQSAGRRAGSQPRGGQPAKELGRRQRAETAGSVSKSRDSAVTKSARGGARARTKASAVSKGQPPSVRSSQ